MGAATEGKLGELHAKVATVLIDALEPVTVAEITDDDGEVIQAETTMPVSAAHITAAIQFLKNNNITCVASEDNELGELQRKVRERNERRANRKATRADLADASENVTYLDKLTG